MENYVSPEDVIEVVRENKQYSEKVAKIYNRYYRAKGS